MTVIKVIAVVIFAISCVTIYHNTNSFEPKKRILYIIIGMIAMYFVTNIICLSKAKNIHVDNQNAIDDTLGVIKMIFTPINAMIVISSIGNTLGKVKDKVISTDKAGKKLIIILIAIILIFIFESNYIGSFINDLLG